MDFIVMNRQRVEDGSYKQFLHEFVMISMYSPELGEARLPDHPQLSAVLRVKCHDVDYNEAGEITAQRGFEAYDKILKFDKKMALDMINFIKDNKPALVVVHCDAGLSRSPAVALALSEVFNDGAQVAKMYVKSFVGGMQLYNRHIYRTILKVAKEVSQNQGEMTAKEPV